MRQAWAYVSLFNFIKRQRQHCLGTLWKITLHQSIPVTGKKGPTASVWEAGLMNLFLYVHTWPNIVGHLAFMHTCVSSSELQAHNCILHVFVRAKTGSSKHKSTHHDVSSKVNLSYLHRLHTPTHLNILNKQEPPWSSLVPDLHNALVAE